MSKHRDDLAKAVAAAVASKAGEVRVSVELAPSLVGTEKGAEAFETAREGIEAALAEAGLEGTRYALEQDNAAGCCTVVAAFRAKKATKKAAAEKDKGFAKQ